DVRPRVQLLLRRQTLRRRVGADAVAERRGDRSGEVGVVAQGGGQFIEGVEGRGGAGRQRRDRRGDEVQDLGDGVGLGRRRRAVVVDGRAAGRRHAVEFALERVQRRDDGRLGRERQRRQVSRVAVDQ